MSYPVHSQKLIQWLLMSVLLLLTGCAATPSATTTLKANESIAPFGNLLIVGIGNDGYENLRFERQLAKSVMAKGVKAQAFSDAVNNGFVVDEETVRRVALETGADGVMVTHLRSVTPNLKVNDRSNDIVRTPAKGSMLARAFLYEYSKDKSTSSISLTADVILTTDLYTMENGDKIWSVDSASFDVDNAATAIERNVKAIVNQLAQDKLLK